LEAQFFIVDWAAFILRGKKGIIWKISIPETSFLLMHKKFGKYVLNFFCVEKIIILRGIKETWRGREIFDYLYVDTILLNCI
jgi:hypothetical protein